MLVSAAATHRSTAVYALAGSYLLCFMGVTNHAQAQPAAVAGAPDGSANGAAQAPTVATTSDAPSASQHDPDAPHTLFLGSVAMLGMPAAELCPQANHCTPADAAIGFGLAAIGRWDNFGVGGGFTWAFGLLPTEVALADSQLLRQHARTYLVIEGQFRYYLPRASAWEWWVGANLGGVVVNDSFTTLADRQPYADTDLIGPKAVTLRSEGAAVSLGIGGHWRFTDQFIFGTRLRYANWLLPVERNSTPLGDLASLAGRIDVIDIGVVVGARLPM